MAYSVILFDFGETLARTSFDVWASAYLPLLRRHGFQASVEQVAEAWRRAWEGVDTFQGVEHVAYSGSAEAYDTWRARIEARALTHLGMVNPSSDLVAGILELQDSREYALFEDVLPALAALRERGYRLGVVSNFTWRLPEIIEELAVGQYIERVIVSARAGYRKPHPEIFRQALAAFDVTPEETLFVGDSRLADIDGARRAGMSGVLLNRSASGANTEDGISALTSLPETLDLMS